MKEQIISLIKEKEALIGQIHTDDEVCIGFYS